ncbi:O-antigen ligase family protein [Marinobacter sp. HN1S83]|uniref:O-antigen ligase family protein n=1 Tax=Marinobacter sp. HN1S83 TaxID=3382301 RepID=UPI00387A8AB4
MEQRRVYDGSRDWRVKALPFIAYAVCGAGVLSLILVLFGEYLVPGSIGSYASQRFMLVLVMGLLSVFSLTMFALKGPSDAFWLAKLSLPTILLCSAFLLFSLPFSENEYVWAEPGMYALFFLTMNLVGLLLKGTGMTMVCVRLFSVGMAAACALYGLSCINIYLFALLDGNPNFGSHIPYGFGSIRYWSHIATWCLPLFPLAVLMGPLKHKRAWRLFVLAGAGMWWWILIQSMGRGSLLGIAFGVLLAISLFGKRALPWFKVFLIQLAVGILIWLLLSVLIPFVLYDGESQLRTFHTGAAGRLPLFMEAWHRSLENFPFGMGPQSWLTVEPLTIVYASSLKFGHPHNMYLLWAAEYGWLLVMFMGLLVLQAIRYFWQARTVSMSGPATQTLGEISFSLAALTGSVSAALFHAGVSAVFLAPGSMLVGLFVLIMFWALIVPIEPNALSSTGVRKRMGLHSTIVLILSVALCFSWLLWVQGVSNYYMDMRSDSKSYAEEVGKATYPRFWMHGNFPR